LYIPDVLCIPYIRDVPPGMGRSPHRHASGGPVLVVRSFFRPVPPGTGATGPRNPLGLDESLGKLVACVISLY
jgi:hypothetical protein